MVSSQIAFFRSFFAPQKPIAPVFLETAMSADRFQYHPVTETIFQTIVFRYDLSPLF